MMTRHAAALIQSGKTALRAGAGMAAAVALSACGARANLLYPTGAAGPAIPAGERAAPTPADLTVPTTQARPKRSDELLTKSEERTTDEFDLPPG
ncbi:MAG: hypothetical protein ACKOUM_11280 [Sphingopyxis sp.]